MFTILNISARPRSCPPDFENVSNNCYFISSERVGWIEAKKKCELKDAELISLEDKDKEEDLRFYYASMKVRFECKVCMPLAL